MENATHTRWTLLIVILASVAVYCNALVNGFVFDDEFQIVGNPWIKDFSSLSSVFNSQVWGFMPGKSTNYYRPLFHLVYMLTYHFFGLNAWGYHLISVLFHAGTTVLVFLVAKKLLNTGDKAEGPWYIYPPLVAALLFGVHPIHTEAVAWAAGIPDLSCAFFSLLSLYFYMAATDKLLPNVMRLSFSAFLFFLALLCKETAIILPLVLVIYEYSVREGKARTVGIGKRSIPFCCFFIVYIFMRVNAIHDLTRVNEHPELSNYQCFINIFPLLTRYCLQLICPVRLSAVHEFTARYSFFNWAVVGSVFFVCFIVICLIRSYRGFPVVFFSLCLIGLPLVPALYIRAIPYPFAERYLYLPSVGFVLLAGDLVLTFSRKPQYVYKIAVAFALVTGVYAGGTILRNPVWKDNYTLWNDTVKKSPRIALPHNELGIALLKLGRLDEAAMQFGDALQIDPSLGYVRTNYGVALASQGKLNEAINQLEEAIRANPNDDKANQVLRMALAQRAAQQLH